MNLLFFFFLFVLFNDKVLILICVIISRMETLNVLEHFTDIAKRIFRNRKSKHRNCNDQKKKDKRNNNTIVYSHNLLQLWKISCFVQNCKFGDNGIGLKFDRWNFQYENSFRIHKGTCTCCVSSTPVRVIKQIFCSQILPEPLNAHSSVCWRYSFFNMYTKLLNNEIHIHLIWRSFFWKGFRYRTSDLLFEW